MINKIKIFVEVIVNGLQGLKLSFFSSRKDRYGYLAKSSSIKTPIWGAKQNVYIYENCGINADVRFICQAGKFIMRKNCSVGPSLTVITYNHKYNLVSQYPESSQWGELEAHDVIVNEDVWIGANVTLCPGVEIGRGSIIAAGSVCIKSKIYPPYSIIGGNPASFLKFRLSLEDQIIQENLRFIPEERLPIALLQNNWIDFNRNKEI